MRAKQNRQSATTQNLLPVGRDQLESGKAKAAAWHWYAPEEFEKEHLKIIDWDDPDFPSGSLIQCGNMVRLHIRVPNARPTEVASRHPRRKHDTTITFGKTTAKGAHLCFDPDQKHHRLYILLPDAALRDVKARFWDNNPVSEAPLTHWALLAGGHHASSDYPEVMAKPIGILTALVYFTAKKDDGPSFYLHKLGEKTCHFPILTCDEKGRMWICGGNYTAPTPGITN